MSPGLSVDTLLASPRRIARPFQAVPLWALVAAIAIASAAALFLHSQLEGRRAAERQNLVAIADLKGREVEHWRQMLERHAASIGRRASLAGAAAELVGARAAEASAGASADPAARAAARARVWGLLQETADAAAYHGAVLIAADGAVLATSIPGESRVDAELLALARITMEQRRIAAAELLRTPTGIRVATVVPVNDGRGEPVAAVVLESPAEDALFRSVRRWPLPSATGEIRVVRQRAQPAAASGGARAAPADVLSPDIDNASSDSIEAVLAPHAPSRDDARPAVVDDTVIDGRSVLAAVRPIAGTGWAIVATVDTAEVDEHIWARAGEVVATATALFLATVVALIVAARRRAADFHAREAALERARQLAQHARLLDRTMAHELNGPLACMLTNARYALEELRRRPGAHLEDAAEALEDAVDATLRAAEVVRNLQVFAQTGARPEALADLRASTSGR